MNARRPQVKQLFEFVNHTFEIRLTAAGCRGILAGEDVHMRAGPHRAEVTRRRLLDAAGEVFAQEGYHGASLREICRSAGANIAAVKYHFQSKEGLYRDVLVASHRELIEREPLPTLADGEDPREALRRWLTYALRMILLRRAAHPYIGRIMAREMQNPTGVLDDLVKLVMRPVRRELERVIGALLPAGTPARVRGTATNLVLGMCVFHEHSRAILERLGYPPPRRMPDIVRLADCVHAFALGGLAQLSRRVERGSPVGEPAPDEDRAGAAEAPAPSG